jgi:hypothetical protein
MFRHLVFLVLAASAMVACEMAATETSTANGGENPKFIWVGADASVNASSDLGLASAGPEAGASDGATDQPSQDATACPTGDRVYNCPYGQVVVYTTDPVMCMQAGVPAPRLSWKTPFMKGTLSQVEGFLEEDGCTPI